MGDIMEFEKWFEGYAPTAPETLDECASDAWNAALQRAAYICDTRAMKCEAKTREAEDCDEITELRSMAWQFSVIADQIRAMERGTDG